MSRIAVEDRRSLLLDAAFRVIARSGVEGATTRAICGEANMAQASFHYAFESRDELLAELVQRGTTAEMSAVSAPLVSEELAEAFESGDIRLALKAGLNAYVDHLVEDPEREQALLVLAQYARRTPGLEPMAAQMYQRYYEMAEMLLIAGAQTCNVDWDTPPAELAPIAIAATDGITLAYLAHGDRAIADRIVDETVETLLRHIRETPRE
ncbi:TetR/AcrR family transcriptional regulator [Jongsikchunia kroppenstedtii]|uniref:TetR/AcrR family transcriptional regulator n=1 Tax=Jongsikchunia kroppenstedtii TaxID=1121721 RepID=UPI000476802B|nr:TetR family transcriptional regulator [Jongsikchunia kroppenstedtii]